MTSKKAAIVIDPWKLAIFDWHLTQSGYAFENGGLAYPEALILYVHTTNLEALAHVVEAVNEEAARTGATK